MASIQYESDHVVNLAGAVPFASGDNRLCFRHPGYADRCIKVLRNGRTKQLHAASPLYKKMMRETYFDDNRREYSAYQQPAIARSEGAYTRHLACCYGWSRTSLGDGLVTDFIADAEHNPAQTLEAYLSQHGLDAMAQEAVAEFSCFLRSSLILTKNLMPHNLVLAPNGSGHRLVLIDGLGLSTLLPLAKYSRYFARRHVEKRVQWFNFRLVWEVSDRAVSWRDTEAKFRFMRVPLHAAGER